MPKRLWHELTSAEFRGLDPARTVAVLPIGATEQHGPHLTVSVDTTINDGIVARTLALLPDDLPVLVLPTQAIGVSVEHDKFPGSLYLSPETAIAAWTEIGAAVAASGVRKILLLNSHGGQPQAAEIVCRRLRIRHRMFAATCMWNRLSPPTGLVPPEELRFGIHAGQVETALMLALAPDRVRMEKARHFANTTAAWDGNAGLRAGGAVAFGWQAQDLNAEGAVGNAAAATAALGEAVLARAASGLAGLLAEISALDLEAWLTEAPHG
ncbi:MAG: creatininase family protein [Acetobacteraceae bacterium]|jgi:creatinine amidohydrolase|nr:creatininase family protein [Acetobacteraceae bacterium]